MSYRAFCDPISPCFFPGDGAEDQRNLRVLSSHGGTGLLAVLPTHEFVPRDGDLFSGRTLGGWLGKMLTREKNTATNWLPHLLGGKMVMNHELLLNGGFF